jgi:hypothetical protein
VMFWIALAIYYVGPWLFAAAVLYVACRIMKHVFLGGSDGNGTR